MTLDKPNESSVMKMTFEHDVLAALSNYCNLIQNEPPTKSGYNNENFHD